LPPRSRKRWEGSKTAADFFQEARRKSNRSGLMKFLRTVPKAALDPEDEMP
jgi:hypothetical protein